MFLETVNITYALVLCDPYCCFIIKVSHSCKFVGYKSLYDGLILKLNGFLNAALNLTCVQF